MLVEQSCFVNYSYLCKARQSQPEPGSLAVDVSLLALLLAVPGAGQGWPPAQKCSLVAAKLPRSLRSHLTAARLNLEHVRTMTARTRDRF